MHKAANLVRGCRRRGQFLRLVTWLAFAACSASRLSANQNMPFRELDGDRCFMFPDVSHQLVITDEADYEKLFIPSNMRQTCAHLELSDLIAPVDFSKETVLGLWVSGSCRATGFQKEVFKDDIQRRIIYSVTVTSVDRACMGRGIDSLNLVAIPKIPRGYQVIFETIPE